MNTLVILVHLSCVIAIQGTLLGAANNITTIKGIKYIKEVLRNDVDRPYFLAMDTEINYIYFGYTISDEDFKTARIQLDSREFEELDIEDGFSQTIDEKNHIVYFGTSKGIFKYDGLHEATIVLPDVDIWQVYFNKILYYSDFPDQYIHTYIDGFSKPLEDFKEMKINHFCIDKDGDFFYNNSTGLFSQNKGGKVVKYKDVVNNDEIRVITTDIHGNVFVCFGDGIYKVVKPKRILKKVLDVSDAFGLAFDRENRIVYSDSSSLVYLKPKSDDGECCVY